MSQEILTPSPAHCKSLMPTPNACPCRLRLRLLTYLSSPPLSAGRASLISFPPTRRWPAVLSGSPAGLPCSHVRTLFHSLVYLVLGLWLGALVFFGAILAPIAFSQLPPLFPTPAAGIHAAGVVVGGSLVRLHWIGLFCGLIFLIVSVVARAH